MTVRDISNKSSHWLRAKVKVVSGRILGKMRGLDAVRGLVARNEWKNGGNCGLKKWDLINILPTWAV